MNIYFLALYGLKATELSQRKVPMIKESSLKLDCEYWKISTSDMQCISAYLIRHKNKELQKTKQRRAALASSQTESGNCNCKIEDWAEVFSGRGDVV